MEKIIQTLALVLPVIALSSVVLVVCLNLYLKIRRRLYVKVNCWFCNQWTKVLYDEQNSFECPTCLQYNGFTDDGDYNKPIPAQHDEMFNQHVPTPNNVSNYSSSNGLCHLCNNNQQLRMHQLASFIPLNEANYDVEVEHFQKQLDKAYKLCAECETVVKRTIRKQNCLLGLKFSQLRKKGLQLFDLNTSSNGLSRNAKQSFVKRLISVTLVGFAFINLIHIITKFDFSNENLKKTSPKWALGYVLSSKNMYMLVSKNFKNVYFNLFENVREVCYRLLNLVVQLPFASELISYMHSMWNFIENTKLPLLPELPQVPSLDNTVLLCSVAVLLQFILLLWNGSNNSKEKFVQLLVWVILDYLHWKFPVSKLSYVNFIQIAASVAIISSMCTTHDSKKRKQKKKTKHAFAKLDKPKSKKLSDSLDEFSDEEVQDGFTAVHNSTLKSHKNTASYKPVSYIHKPTVRPSTSFENLNKTTFCDNNSTATARDSLNQSFISARSCMTDRTSQPDTATNFYDSKNISMDLDLDVSLNKLNLGNSFTKKPSNTNAFCVNTDVSRPKPVISPAKLRNVTQNSWVAGGFWRDSNGILMPISNCSNLSRSSSQTSGFISQTGHFEQNHFNSLPASVSSFCGDLDCNSVLSEPVFDLNRSNTAQNRNLNCCTRFACPNDARICHPVLNQEQFVYLTPNFAYNGVYNVCFNKSMLNNSSSPNNSFSPNMQKKLF